MSREAEQPTGQPLPDVGRPFRLGYYELDYVQADGARVRRGCKRQPGRPPVMAVVDLNPPPPAADLLVAGAPVDPSPCPPANRRGGRDVPRLGVPPAHAPLA